MRMIVSVCLFVAAQLVQSNVFILSLSRIFRSVIALLAKTLAAITRSLDATSIYKAMNIVIVLCILSFPFQID